MNFSLVPGFCSTLVTAALCVIVAHIASCEEVQLLKDSPKRLCNDFRLYYNETRKCYPEYKKGPCGKLMVMRRENESAMLGKCQCKQFGVSCMESHPTVYWAETQRCYFLFDQGPCKEGEWLVATEDDASKCETISCPAEYAAQPRPIDSDDAYPNSTFVFPNNDKCYSTLTRGFCPEKEIAYFTSDSLEPKCRPEAQLCLIGQSIPGGPKNDCGDGTREDEFQGCDSNAEI